MCLIANNLNLKYLNFKNIYYMQIRVDIDEIPRNLLPADNIEAGTK